MILGKDAIFGITDLEYTELDVPEWGGTIRLQSLTGADANAIGAMSQKDVFTSDALVRLVIMSVVDAEGNKVFTDDNRDELNKRNAQVLIRIGQAALKLNGLSKEAIEDAAKN